MCLLGNQCISFITIGVEMQKEAVVTEYNNVLSNALLTPLTRRITSLLHSAAKDVQSQSNWRLKAFRPLLQDI